MKKEYHLTTNDEKLFMVFKKLKDAKHFIYCENLKNYTLEKVEL